LLQTIIGGPLVAPWGVALAPASFGEFGGDLLVGNFSFVASEINAFDPTTGAFQGTIAVGPGSGNTPGGLWSLQFGSATTALPMMSAFIDRTRSQTVSGRRPIDEAHAVGPLGTSRARL
jgi:hypothetical protein